MWFRGLYSYRQWVRFITLFPNNVFLWVSIKPGTWNIPEHPGTLNNYDNYEKKGVKLNFGLADVTIWSAQIGQVT